MVGGEAIVTGFEANRIDYEALYVESGALNFTNGTATEVAVGLANHATANVLEFTVAEAGVGVQSIDHAARAPLVWIRSFTSWCFPGLGWQVRP